MSTGRERARSLAPFAGRPLLHATSPLAPPPPHPHPAPPAVHYVAKMAGFYPEDTWTCAIADMAYMQLEDVSTVSRRQAAGGS